MEKQHSVRFFESFVRDIHKQCQNFVSFDQMVEVSGYLCLEIDNVKKERYLLSELIQSSGTVISESFCTKVFRNCPTQRPSAQRGNVKRNMAPPNPALNQNRPGQGVVMRQQNMLQHNTRTPQRRAGQNQQMPPTSQGVRTGPNVPGNAQITPRGQGSHINQLPQAGPVMRKGPATMPGRQRHNSASAPLMNRQNNSQVGIVHNPDKLSFNQRLDHAVTSKFDGTQKTKDTSQGGNQQGQSQYTKQFDQFQSVNQQGQGQHTNHQSRCINQQGQGQFPNQVIQCQGVNQQGQGQHTNHQSRFINQQGQGQYINNQGQCVNQVEGFHVKEEMNRNNVQDPNLAKWYGQNVFPQAVPQSNVQDKSNTARGTNAILKQEEGQTCKEVYQTASNSNQQNIHDMKPTVPTSAVTGQDGFGQVIGASIDHNPKTPCDSFQQKGRKVQKIHQAAQTSTLSSKVPSRSSISNMKQVGQNPSLTIVPNQQTQCFSAPVPDQVFLQQRENPIQGINEKANQVQTLEKTTDLSKWQMIEMDPEVSVVSVTPGTSAVGLSTKSVSAPDSTDHPFQKDPAAMNQNNPSQFISQGHVSRTQVMNITPSSSSGQAQNISQTQNVNPAQMFRTGEPATASPVQSTSKESYLKHQPFVSVAQCVSNSQPLSHLQKIKLPSGYEKAQSEPLPQSSSYPSKPPVCPTQEVYQRVSALKSSMSGPKNLLQSSNPDHGPPTLKPESELLVFGLTQSSNVNPRPLTPFYTNSHPQALHMIIDRREMHNPPKLSPQTPGEVSGPSSSDSFERLESSILISSLTSSAHEADKQQIKLKSSMNQQLVASSTEPSTSDWKTPQIDPNPKASAVPAKKAKLSLEPSPENATSSMPKQPKKKGKEMSAKKQVKKGRRKSTKPKKVDVNDLTSDEDNDKPSAGPVPKRNLRSAQRTARQVYREEDPDLSDNSGPEDN